MTVHIQVLSSHFTSTPVSRANEREYLNAYYTLRRLIWKTGTGRIFREAIVHGVIAPVAPGRRGENGTWIPPEYDEAEVSELFERARAEFNEQFDDAFREASLGELFATAKKHLGLDKAAFLRAIEDFVTTREAQKAVS